MMPEAVFFLSQCTRTASLNAFFDDFPYTNNEQTNQTSSEQTNQTSNTFVSLFGCGCSPATVAVAEISHYWNIPQVS